ncbi:MAG: flagellar biosynthetic protein FliO [Thermoguttaceae bacterium]|nr:flagellar biosynthetic protein FliO [Thermoguttaceae bacterium]MDW8037274.1 flagellar biosynthetic protein FliO [Thermoguttaceae bacterium]
MPSGMCWWLWGALILGATGSQAAEGFWAAAQGTSFGAGQQVASRPEKPSISKVLSPLDAEASSYPPPLLDAGSAAPKEAAESPPSSGGYPEQCETKCDSNPREDGQFGVSTKETAASGAPGGRGIPLRLGPPQTGRPLSDVSGRAFDPTASSLTVLSSLAVILGVFLLLVWAIRRAMPPSAQLLPKDVVEVLGRAPLMAKQQMYLLRCGPKLLLISVSPEGAETLTEIEHPDEVAHIVALCRQSQPGSIAGSFRQILEQLGRQSPRKWESARGGPVPDESTKLPNPVEEESGHG